MSMVERICKCCGAKFQARNADVKRGWALFCSKRCKAVKQESRTGQYRAYMDRDDLGFNDSHLFSNEEYDCNKD